MYYASDPRHEPEIRIDIVDCGPSTDKDVNYFYAHKKCFRKYFIKKRFLFAGPFSHHGKVKDNKVGDP